jgi:hypothetical protein
MILISVDFPAPFSPTIACTSPACSSNETWRRALTPSNDFVMDDAERSAGGKRQDDKAATPAKANLSWTFAGVAFRLSYQASLKPNCAARPSSAVVMVAAVAFEIFVSGFPKLL